MLQIPLQAIPSQRLQVVLNLQNVQIAIYQKAQGLFVDVSLNGEDVSAGILALNLITLTWTYSGFVGNLMFLDTQGNDDPTYDGLGSRYQLLYMDADEYAAYLAYVPTVPEDNGDYLTDELGALIYTDGGEKILVVRVAPDLLTDQYLNPIYTDGGETIAVITEG